MKFTDKEAFVEQWQQLKSITQAFFSAQNPFLLYHYITTKCDCKCPYCFYASGNQNDLTTLELLSIYEQAKELGYLGTIITGGEPFTRPDLPVILQYIKKKNFHINLMTNGNYLEERWQEVAKFVDQLVISVDIADDALEDIRHKADTFQNIVNGIDFVKQHNNLPILINSILWKENFNQIEELAIFAKDMEVEINFYPMDPIRTYDKNDTDSKKQWALPYSSLSEAFQLISNLKKEGYPIINSTAHIQSFIDYKPRFQCRFLHFFTQIMANGDVVNCSMWRDILGNIRTDTLSKILHAPHTTQAIKNARNCNNCNRSEVYDASNALSWHLDSLKNLYRLF